MTVLCLVDGASARRKQNVVYKRWCPMLTALAITFAVNRDHLGTTESATTHRDTSLRAQDVRDCISRISFGLVVPRLNLH